MDAKKWKSKVKKACENIGTYSSEFDPVIRTLANLMESRDRVYEQFISSGGNPVISYTNKGGATNLVKNPLMVSWLDIDAMALTYWRELGLTPQGYKKLSDKGKVVSTSKKPSLLDALANITEE